MIGNDRMIYRRGASQSATLVVAASDSLHQGYADYVCDGVDDQVEIQAAIEALPSGGGKVVLLDGEYTLNENTSNALNAAINIGRSNVTLEGSGWGTILKLKDGITAPSILQSYSPAGSNIIIRNLQIDGNKANTTDPGVHTHGCGFHSSGLTDFIIENLYVHDIWYRGLSFYSGERGIIRNNNIVDVYNNCVNLDHSTSYVTVTGNYLSATGSSAGIEVDASTGHINVRNIITNNIVSGYFGIRGTSIGVQECVIANNNIYDSTHGISFEGKNSIISHNNINHTDNTPLKLGGYTNRAIGNIFIYTMNSKIEIAGNYNNLIGNSILGGRESGILVSGNHNIVRDCIMLRSRDGTGITIEGDYNKICGNQILNTDWTNTNLSEAASSGATVINVASISSLYEGLYILIRETGKTDTYGYITKILDNELTISAALNDSYTTAASVMLGYHAYWITGISLAAGATGNEIENNHIYGVATPLSDSGTNTVIQNNNGYTTENSGTATLANGSTSIAVNHGLDVTPSAGDIMVTPMGSLGSASFFYIDTFTSTQFTIHTNADPGVNVDFAWKAIVL